MNSNILLNRAKKAKKNFVDKQINNVLKTVGEDLLTEGYFSTMGERKNRNKLRQLNARINAYKKT